MPAEHRTEAEIHEALEKTGGLVAEAAAILGMTTSAVRLRIKASESLQSRWNVSKPPEHTIATALHRPSMSAEKPTLPRDSDVAEALNREQATLGASLKQIKAKDVNFAVALQNFQRQNYRGIVEMVSGGIAKQYLDIMTRLDEIDSRLNRTEEDGKLPLAEEMMLRNDRVQLLGILDKFKTTIDKSVLIAAKVRAMSESGNNNGKGAPRKPGFKPLEKPIDV